MNRSTALVLALLGGFVVSTAPPALAQQSDAISPEEAASLAEVRASLARAGITEVAPPLPLPPRPTADVPDDIDHEARLGAEARAAVERRLAELRGAPAEPPTDNLSVAGDVRVRGVNTTVRIRANANIGELHTWQGLDVCSTCQISATSGALVFRGGQTAQRFRAGGPLTIGRFRVSKSGGRAVLDSVGVGGAGSFSFGTLDLTTSTLATPTSLPITTALLGTGVIAFTGTATQTLTLPAAGLTIPNVYLEKPSGTAAFAQATTIGGTLRNAGTATLTGDVTVATTGTLDLDAGTLTLGQDLPVFGVLAANGGTFAPNGFTLSLDPTLDGGGQIDQLAAVGGDGSTLTASSPFARPYVDGEGWRMIAAPFAATPFASLTDDFHTQGGPGADAPFGTTNLYGWDPTQPPGSRYVGVTDFTQAFTPGVGYFFYAYATDPGTGTPELPTAWDVEGVEPADTVTVLLSYNGSDFERRFNLLGNPFAAPLDWHDIQLFGRFRAAYSVWDPAANGGLGNYALYSTAGVSTGRANRYIPAFQGYWAESTILTPFGILYDRPWKAPYDSPVYAGRGGDEEVHQLRFALQGAGLEATEPVALFLPDGAVGPDIYDTSWLVPLSSDYAAAYFVQDSTVDRLIFEGRPPDSEGATLALAVATTRPGTYTLSWPALDLAPAWQLVLEDHETGARVDLRQQQSYTFSLAPSEGRGDPLALRTPAEGGRATVARFAVRLGGVLTDGEGGATPAALTLAAPRPNPAQGAVRLRYGLPQAGAARVVLYDVLGRHVATLADGEQAAGWHEARWDAAALAGGVYVVRLEAGGETRTTRLTVAR